MKKEYDADILKAFSQSYFTGVLVTIWRMCEIRYFA